MTTPTTTREPRTHWCKHHTSPGPLRQECALGLNIEAIVTAQVGAERLGRHYMLPCHTSTLDHISKAVCDKRLMPTAEEVAADDEAREEFMKDAIRRLHISGEWVVGIKRNHKGQDAAGSDKCPVCGNRILYRHAAYNGHVAARCDTDGCLNFME